MREEPFESMAFMRKIPLFSRIHEISKIQRDLERNSFPRLQMTLLVGITGASGFAASSLLFHMGLHTMWLRFLLAFGVAYGVFLALLGLWLRTRLQDYLDLPSPSSNASSDTSIELPSIDSPGLRDVIRSGGGGNFGGGGASASFDASAMDTLTGGGSTTSMADAVGDSVGDSVGGAIDAATDSDDFFIVILIIALALALAAASMYMVYIAPSLFAELAVDGLASAGLYRKLRFVESEFWLRTAIRRTAIPFVLTAALVSGIGWLIGDSAPHAHTLGEALTPATTTTP